jgi:cell division septal protein FtsQ
LGNETHHAALAGAVAAWATEETPTPPERLRIAGWALGACRGKKAEDLLRSWVGEASLRRVLPDTVAVTLIEREPMAVARLGSALYLLDWNGRLIDAFGPDYADLDLPLVDGVGTPGPPAPAVARERAALAVRVLAAVRSSSALADRISQVDVTDVRDAVVILEGDTALVRIGRERFAERLESYLDIVPVLRERVPAIDYVDLRFDERVYVRPLEGPGADAGPGARGRGPSGS